MSDEVVVWAESDPLPPSKERYPKVAAMLEELDETNRRVALIRLASEFNNGSAHFDHSEHPITYSWLCLACARAGKGPYFVDAREMGQ